MLAVVGGTPIDSNSLASIVLDGYLSSVKVWLADILSPPLGMFLRVCAHLPLVMYFSLNSNLSSNRFRGYAFAFTCEHY